MSLMNKTKAELIKVIEGKDSDIKKLEEIIVQKNAELSAPSDAEQRAQVLELENEALKKTLLGLTADMRNFLQLNASATDIVNASLNKTLTMLGLGGKE